MKDDQMAGSCSVHQGDKKCRFLVSGSVDDRIILK